jgi:hypothetical protein
MPEPDSETRSWLRCLISSYKQEHDWEGDEDPSATQEMLTECEKIADWLETVANIDPEDPDALDKVFDDDLPY